MQEQCRRVLDGELTTTDALIQLPSERERQSLCNAVASTCIEGVEVAKQMVKDCVRQMRKLDEDAARRKYAGFIENTG